MKRATRALAGFCVVFWHAALAVPMAFLLLSPTEETLFIASPFLAVPATAVAAAWGLYGWSGRTRRARVAFAAACGLSILTAAATPLLCMMVLFLGLFGLRLTI